MEVWGGGDGMQGERMCKREIKVCVCVPERVCKRRGGLAWYQRILCAVYKHPTCLFDTWAIEFPQHTVDECLFSSA